MGKDTKISWAHHTFNPWLGCFEVSPACDNCYARELAHRFFPTQQLWGKDGVRRPASEKSWAEVEKWAVSARRRGVTERVFCESMGDLFEARPDLDRWRSRLWELIERTSDVLIWMLLTKRPENMLSMTPVRWGKGWPKNVWAGVTAENERRLKERMVYLERVPANVRFLSVEPMLGPMNLTPYLAYFRAAEGAVAVECPHGYDACPECDAGPIHWVICGGESGQKARPSHPDWFRTLRNECVRAGVPFHMKQWGSYVPRASVRGKISKKRLTMVTASGEPGDVTGLALMARVGARKAGNVLDGRRWLQFPTSTIKAKRFAPAQARP